MEKKISKTNQVNECSLNWCSRFYWFSHRFSFAKKKNFVYGIDDVNPYYDVSLKRDRLSILRKYKNFYFIKKKIEDKKIHSFFKKKKIDVIINLAAQAGVRHSLKNPYVYIESNVLGQVNMLELARLLNVKKFIYASSSSVYGGNKNMPFSVNQRVDNPISLYAASKKSTELVAECYSHLFNMKCIGLRFFTVYGPWGRPDMATFIFTKNILENKIIEIFNYGKMERDFTYIGDIVDGIERILNKIKTKNGFFRQEEVKYKIYNLGNNKPVKLFEFVSEIEKVVGKNAKIKNLGIQP